MVKVLKRIRIGEIVIDDTVLYAAMLVLLILVSLAVFFYLVPSVLHSIEKMVSEGTKPIIITDINGKLSLPIKEIKQG